MKTISSLLFALLLVACTSGGSGPIGGTSSGGASSSGAGSSSGGTSTSSGNTSNGDPVGPAIPQAIATLNGGAAAGCATVPALKVGQFADATAHRPVKNGETEDGESVTVACRVAPTGAGFAVNLTITKGTTAIAISDDVDASGASTTANMNVTSGATWSSASCKLDASGIQMGVAAGRYWAMVTCMGATSSSGETCDIFAQVRVENCTPD